MLKFQVGPAEDEICCKSGEGGWRGDVAGPHIIREETGFCSLFRQGPDQALSCDRGTKYTGATVADRL